MVKQAEDPESTVSAIKDLVEPDTEDSRICEPKYEAVEGFPDHVYLLASEIFQKTHKKKPVEETIINYGTQTKKHLVVMDTPSDRCAYQLAFNTLKYQVVIEDILIDSTFYTAQATPENLISLVAVMLYDFQDRKFVLRNRPADEEELEDVRLVELELIRFKTKLAASLARFRIKNNLFYIEEILPEELRQKETRASSLPLYAWINTINASHEDVHSTLENNGFLEVQSVRMLAGLSFCEDVHFKELLAFPPHVKPDLQRTELLSKDELVVQDKICCVGPVAVRAMLKRDRDVLISGPTSSLTVAHMASLIAQRSGTVIYCQGKRHPSQVAELTDVLEKMNCNNVTVLPVKFIDLNPSDPRLENMRAILLTPHCSLSAVSNPVDFIIKESGDAGLLPYLSQGIMEEDKLKKLVNKQREALAHALKFPKVNVVVYSTFSSYPEENEELVAGVLKESLYRLTLPKQLAQCMQKKTDTKEAYFKLENSEEGNGCFVAVLTREPSLKGLKEKQQEVLTQALAVAMESTEAMVPTKKKSRKKSMKCSTKIKKEPTSQPKTKELQIEESKESKVSEPKRKRKQSTKNIKKQQKTETTEIKVSQPTRKAKQLMSALHHIQTSIKEASISTEQPSIGADQTGFVTAQPIRRTQPKVIAALRSYVPALQSFVPAQTNIGAAQTGFGAPQTGCGAAQTGFGAAQTGFGAAQTGFGEAQTGFGEAQTGFGAAQTGFGAAQTGFGAAQTGFGAAQTGFGEAQMAQTGFGAAQTSFGAAQTGFGAAKTGFGAAKTGFGAAQTGFGEAQTADGEAQTADGEAQTADGTAQTADGTAQTGDTSAQTADVPGQIGDEPAQTDVIPTETDVIPAQTDIPAQPSIGTPHLSIHVTKPSYIPRKVSIVAERLSIAAARLSTISEKSSITAEMPNATVQASVLAETPSIARKYPSIAAAYPSVDIKPIISQCIIQKILRESTESSLDTTMIRKKSVISIGIPSARPSVTSITEVIPCSSVLPSYEPKQEFLKPWNMEFPRIGLHLPPPVLMSPRRRQYSINSYRKVLDVSRVQHPQMWK